MGRMLQWVLSAAFCIAAGLACARTRSGTPTGISPAQSYTSRIGSTSIERIRFARGTTSSIIKDSLPAGGIRTYVLWAEQGQVLLGHAIPWPERRNRVAEGRISLAVSRGSDWRSLTGPKRQESLWWGRLPSSGEYLLRVAVTGAPTAYTLSVRIPRRLVVNREKPVAALSGVAPPGALVDYLVKGAAGQILDADLQGSGHGTHLHIYGLNDGIQLARLGERLQRFTGTLPSAQDYVISVAPAAEGTPYGLQVTV